MPLNLRELRKAAPPAHLSRKDREFLAPALEVVSTPPSPILIGLASTICALLLLAIVGAWFTSIDIYAVAPGRIQPTGRSKIIQPVEGGKVSRIAVRDGDPVRAGQVLMELDRTATSSEEAQLSGQVEDLDAQIARRLAVIRAARTGAAGSRFRAAFQPGASDAVMSRETAVLEADIDRLAASVALLQAKIDENQAQKDALTASIAAEKQLIATLSERVRMRADLQREGWDSRAHVIDAEEALNREKTDLATHEGQYMQLSANAATLRQQIRDTKAQFIAENTTSLADAEGRRDTSRSALVKASDKVRQTVLTAPVDGTVQQLGVTTVGQVVASGQQLMTIVPQRAGLELQVFVLNRDIGFIRQGQTAVVKIDSFPFTRYGAIGGRVATIAHDAVDANEAAVAQDTRDQPISGQNSAAAATPKTRNLVFPVTILLDHPFIMADGRAAPLGAGMSASAEIKTGKRRVLDYLLSPLVETSSTAGHEQ